MIGTLFDYFWSWKSYSPVPDHLPDRQGAKDDLV